MTAAMSLLFNQRLRLDMMVTGFVAAIVCDQLVRRVTRHYRRRLAAVYETTAGKIAAGVSHEICSPLQVICIASEELDSRGDDIPADERRQLTTDIRDASARIMTIARDLKSFARPIDDPLGPVALARVVRSATRLASYHFGEGVVLEHGPLEVPPVKGNESRLVQIVLNLVVNAARAKRPDAVNTIRVAAKPRAGGVELSVSDTGTGMTAEPRARLFEPFFTTGAARGGTGLGLTICRSLVEKMGGSIELDSTPGAGTTMRVLLPAAA